MSGVWYPEVLLGWVGELVDALAVGEGDDLVALPVDHEDGCLDPKHEAVVAELVEGQQGHAGEHTEGGEEGRLGDESADGATCGDVDGGAGADGASVGDDARGRDAELPGEVIVGGLDVTVDAALGGSAFGGAVSAIVVGEDGKAGIAEKFEKLDVIAEVFGISVREEDGVGGFGVGDVKGGDPMISGLELYKLRGRRVDDASGVLDEIGVSVGGPLGLKDDAIGEESASDEESVADDEDDEGGLHRAAEHSGVRINGCADERSSQ